MVALVLEGLSLIVPFHGQSVHGSRVPTFQRRVNRSLSEAGEGGHAAAHRHAQTLKPARLCPPIMSLRLSVPEEGLALWCGELPVMGGKLPC